VVTASVMAIELQKQLLAQARGLDGRKVALMAWEDGLSASKHALGQAYMVCDAKRDRAKTIR
jgi:hypothetical protein